MDAKRLRLMAEDAADLAVLSATLQDAVVQVGDIRFGARTRSLTLEMNRFRWETGAKAGKGGERVRTALQLNGVLAVKTLRLRREPKNAVVELLAVAFQPGEAPGGVVTLIFAGGGELSCDVECIDAVLADVSEPWPAKSRPVHAEG